MSFVLSRALSAAARVALIAAVSSLVVSSTVRAQMSMLQASGRNIVNANGQVVQLQGVNLGGWFVMEAWMTPLDSGGLPDTYSVIQELDNRFGVAEEQSLIGTYQQNWIIAADLDNIKNAGFNCVRVPVWWGMFYPINNVSNSGWRSDAFTELDWLVNAAAARGIYVIIDMHGVVGSQSTSGDTGQQNLNAYWTNGNDQGNTAYMWRQIANHYNGNPTVAAYDVMNEPINAPSNTAVISAYSSLYNSIRSADPNHIVIMEGTWGNWDWSMLPNPSSEGWTNVAYEMHEYQYNQSESVVEQGSVNQVNDFNNHASYNVPGYIGEFNDMYNESSVWNASLLDYNLAGLSWTMWSYKSTNALNPSNWGLYAPTYWAATPNISTDSAATIAADWAQWTTANAFGLNTSIGVSGNVNSVAMNTGAWYSIVNANSGLCLDAQNWGTSNGTLLQQYTCGSNQSNQEWQFVSEGTGIYSVVNRNAPSEAWNVVNTGTANASPMQLWTYGGGTNEQWRAVSLGNNQYKFVGIGSGRCLDVPGASTANNVQLDIYDCNGTGAQIFTLTAQ